MPFLFYSLTLTFICQTIAQERYASILFENIKQTTETYSIKENKELKVDIFSPEKDTVSQRPLLLYVHGGGFSGGERDHPNHIRFCKNLAKKGYVTATMSYTLVMKGKSFSCDRPAPEKIETFLLTARDISRATKFFIDNAAKYGIDTEKIVILGSSAGAEAVLHAAYWKETRKDKDGIILPDDFKYGGVVSMAGAITNLEWINAESAIPTFLYHGTCDNLVPYGSAPHHYCDVSDPGYLVLHGGYSIAEKLRSLGKPYTLVTGCYGRHEWNDKPLREMESDIAMQIKTSLIDKSFIQYHKVIEEGQKPCPYFNEYQFCGK